MDLHARRERIKKALTLAEGIVLLLGVGCVLTHAILNLVLRPGDAYLVSSILLIVMCGISLIMTIATFPFFKTKDIDFIQPGYDYCYNSLALAMIPSGVLFLINSDEPSLAGIDSFAFYALIVMATIALNSYGLIGKRRMSTLLRWIPFLCLFAAFCCYLFINPVLFAILGFSLVLLAALLAAIATLFREKKEGEKESDTFDL